MANERELLGKLFHVVDHDGDGVVDQSEILAFLGHLYHDHQYCTLQSVTKEHSEEAFASYLFLKWQQPSPTVLLRRPRITRCSPRGREIHSLTEAIKDGGITKASAPRCEPLPSNNGAATALLLQGEWDQICSNFERIESPEDVPLMNVWWNTTLPRLIAEEETHPHLHAKVQASKEDVHEMIENIHDEALLERSYYLRKQLQDMRKENRHQAFETSVNYVSEEAVPDRWHSAGWGSHGVTGTGRDWSAHDYIRSGRPSFGKTAPAGGAARRRTAY